MFGQRKSVAVISVVVLAIVLYSFYSGRTQPIVVEVEKIERGTIEQTVANTRAGTVMPCKRAKMSPAAGGQIATLAITEGQHVEQGTLLLELWNEDLRAQVALNRSEADAAVARSESACVQADIAEKIAQRRTELRKSKTMSEDLIDQAVATAKSTRADCNAARENAKVSLERINLSQAMLQRTQLVAPFSGVIVEVNGEIGEYVTPSPPGIPTLPAIDMVDTSCFYVTAPIDEVDAPLIKRGMPARISLDAFRDRTFSGQVHRIADYVLDREKQARTVDIEVSFVDPTATDHLLPGYSADAEVIISTRNNVLRVPTDAIIEDHQVYIFNQSLGLLELREVKTGLANWDHTEIESGVAEGEWVVIRAVNNELIDGAVAKQKSSSDHD